MGTGLEWAAIAAFTASTASTVSQVKASQAQERGNKARARGEALAAAVKRREQIKAYRQLYAQTVQAGENQGVATSSGVAGAASSVSSQMAANVSFLDQQTQLADFAGAMFNRAANWSNKATLFGGAAQLATMGVQTEAAAEQKKTLEDLLKPR